MIPANHHARRTTSGPGMAILMLALCALCGLVASRASRASAQTKPAANPAAAEIQRAIREARKELDEAQKQADRLAKDAETKLAEETKAVIALRGQEASLAAKHQALETELEALKGKTGTAQSSKTASRTALDQAHDELDALASRLKEDISGSLVTAQDQELPSLLEEVRTDRNQALQDKVKSLTDVFGKVLTYARTSALIKLPVRVPALGDRVMTLNVLRLGMLAGYFANPATLSSGFVVADPGSVEGWVADSEGLSRKEQGRIAGLIAKPSGGGAIPLDVTGGTANAARRTTLTAAAWFRRGGIWMWILAGVAALALCVALERIVSLAVGSIRIRRATKLAIGYAHGTRQDKALEGAHKLGKSPVGAILRAALMEHEHGRERLEAAVQEALLTGSRAIETRVGLLRLAALSAALVGFLGTVVGLGSTLRLLGIAGADAPSTLALGLSEALIPTEAGLLVAVPCFVLHGILRAAADRAAGRLETAALSIVVAIGKEEEAAAALGIGEPA